MISLIANKVKTNMHLVYIKLSLLFTLTYVPLFKLIPRIRQYLFVRNSYLITTFLQATLVRHSFRTTIRYSAYNLFVSNTLIR